MDSETPIGQSDNEISSCEGCHTNHPSQDQHMGPGGCLSDTIK